MTDLNVLAAANAARWQNARLTRDSGAVARRLVSPSAKARYQSVYAKTGVHWAVIAVIHERECSQDWERSLAQGDPWNRTSVHVPAGRGPFVSWEAAAVDALLNCAPYAARNRDWSIGQALTKLEEYNGLGYAARGLPSPYLWSGTDQYKSGKYVRDGVYDPEAVDGQFGCAGLLKAGGARSDCGAYIGAICLHRLGSDAKLVALSSVEADTPLSKQSVEGLDRRVRCFHSRSPVQKEMNHVDFVGSRHVCSRLCGVLVLQGPNCPSGQRCRSLREGAREQGCGLEGCALMLGKIKAICLHSLTVAWGYLLAISGAAMAAIDNIGDALGDPNLRDQINNAIGDARVAGRILLCISIITILARLRSLRKPG